MNGLGMADTLLGVRGMQGVLPGKVRTALHPVAWSVLHVEWYHAGKSSFNEPGPRQGRD